MSVAWYEQTTLVDDNIRSGCAAVRSAYKTPAKILRYQAALISKQCIECGQSFVQRRSLLAVCSDECKAIRYARLRPQTYLDCKACGKRFGPVDRLDQKYCSKACSTEAKKGVPSGKGGRTFPHLRRARVGWCLTCGAEYLAVKDFGKRHQLYCSHPCYLRNRRVSHFEVSVGDFLRSCGIDLEPQKKIGRFTYDFLLLDTNLLVEADGSYWHAFEKVQERDVRKTVAASAAGYELHRIDELAFNKDPQTATDVIVARYEAFTGKQAQRPARILAEVSG